MSSVLKRRFKESKGHEGGAFKSLPVAAVVMIPLFLFVTRGHVFAPFIDGQQVSFKEQRSSFVDFSRIDPTNVTSIENAIIEHGLFPYGSWQLDNFPEQMHPYSGHGLGIYQHPSQFGPYLHFLKNYLGDRGLEINSYAEVGVAAGGTFIFTTEFLGASKAYAVDISPFPENIFPAGFPYKGQLAAYIDEQNGRAEFVHGDREALRSLLDARKENIDLLMIDGDHGYDPVKADFEALEKYAKVIAFHDIVCRTSTDVGRFWRELRQSGEYETHEFVSQYSGVGEPLMGIGVLVKQPFQKAAAPTK